MVSNESTRNLFTYPKIDGLVDLATEDIELSFDEETRLWLENVLIEYFNDGINNVSPHRIRPWSQVFKVETIRNASYFLKMPAREFYKEAQILELIERFDPDITVKVLARNSLSGAFLMTAFEGDTLRIIARKQFDELIVEDSAERIGEFQKNAREYLPDFEKLNIPKWTSETIIQDCKSLIKQSRFLSHSGLSSKSIDEFVSLLPSIQKKLNTLASFDKGLSIEHGDFQDNNIFISEERILFMDWGDVNISSPSFTIGTYCHSILLAHPMVTNKPRLIQKILTKYYFTLLGFENYEDYQYHASLVHFLYPMICILKVGRLLNLREKKSDKYASTIIDYWIRVAISFGEAYRDKSLGNKIT